METDSEIAGPSVQGGTISDSPTVSVVIPTYGHRDFIGRTLDSVFAQTWTDYEIIVVNDGSPDDTEVVLQPLIDTGKIRYIRQENAGVAAARSRGMGLACGEFIALLDDDDLWPPNKLATQVELMRSNPGAVLVYGNLIHIDGNDAPFVPRDWEGRCHGLNNPGPSGQVFEAFAEENWIISPGQTLIRHSKLIEMDKPLLDPTIWGADDWDLWLRLADRGDFLYCPEIVLLYRLHANNTSRNVLRMNENCLKVLRKHSKRHLGCPERLRMLTETYAKWLDVDRGYLFYCALRANRQGDFRDGMRHLSFLAKVNPHAVENERYRALFAEVWRWLLSQQGDFRDSMRQLRFLAKVNLDAVQNETYCTLFAEICRYRLYQQGDFRDGMRQLLLLAKVNPDTLQNEWYYTLFAEIWRYRLYRQGDFHDCIRQLLLLANVNPHAVQNERYHALFTEICRWLLSQQGDFRDGMRQLLLLAKVNPDIVQNEWYYTLFTEIWRYRLYRQGDFRDGMRQLLLLAKVNPDIVQNKWYRALFTEIYRWFWSKSKQLEVLNKLRRLKNKVKKMLPTNSN